MAETIPLRRLDDRRPTPSAPRPLPPPPRHLSAHSKRIWHDITAEWIIGPEALPILQAGLEQRDLYVRALEQLRREGFTVTHPKTGAIRQHPAHGISRDALREYRQCFRALNLQPPET